MLKFTSINLLLFIALATTLFSCDDGETCAPANELTGYSYYKLINSADMRFVYEFKSCGYASFRTQSDFDGDSEWTDMTGSPQQGEFSVEDNHCYFTTSTTNFGFDFGFSGNNLVVSNSNAHQDHNGVWQEL